MALFCVLIFLSRYSLLGLPNINVIFNRVSLASLSIINSISPLNDPTNTTYVVIYLNRHHVEAYHYTIWKFVSVVALNTNVSHQYIDKPLFLYDIWGQQNKLLTCQIYHLHVVQWKGVHSNRPPELYDIEIWNVLMNIFPFLSKCKMPCASLT